MTENAAMSSAIRRTANDAIVEKISQAIDCINLLESHLVLLKAKIAKEYETNETTEINHIFLDKVLQVCCEVQNYKNKVRNETNKFFNLVPRGVGEPLPNPEMENFRRQITESADLITPLQVIEMELANDREQLEFHLAKKQRESNKLIAEVGDRLERADSHTQPREIPRSNDNLMKIKIDRFVINSFLAEANIDYEKHPDLMDLKIKWRDPISLKAKTD